MDLILWRHAEAEEGHDDLARALTPRGRRQAARMAQWLKAHVAEPWSIAASPARRTQETVAALHLPFRTEALLAPAAAPAARLLQHVGWPHGEGTLLLVGHQPVMGQMAALALTGHAAAWSLRKGAVYWLTSRDREGVAPVQLRACLAPELLGEG